MGRLGNADQLNVTRQSPTSDRSACLLRLMKRPLLKMTFRLPERLGNRWLPDDPHPQRSPADFPVIHPLVKRPPTVRGKVDGEARLRYSWAITDYPNRYK